MRWSHSSSERNPVYKKALKRRTAGTQESRLRGEKIKKGNHRDDEFWVLSSGFWPWMPRQLGDSSGIESWRRRSGFLQCQMRLEPAKKKKKRSKKTQMGVIQIRRKWDFNWNWDRWRRKRERERCGDLITWFLRESERCERSGRREKRREGGRGREEEELQNPFLQKHEEDREPANATRRRTKKQTKKDCNGLIC